MKTFFEYIFEAKHLLRNDELPLLESEDTLHINKVEDMKICVIITDCIYYDNTMLGGETTENLILEYIHSGLKSKDIAHLQFIYPENYLTIKQQRKLLKNIKELKKVSDIKSVLILTKDIFITQACTSMTVNITFASKPLTKKFIRKGWDFEVIYNEVFNGNYKHFDYETQGMLDNFKKEIECMYTNEEHNLSNFIEITKALLNDKDMSDTIRCLVDIELNQYSYTTGKEIEKLIFARQNKDNIIEIL